MSFASSYLSLTFVQLLDSQADPHSLFADFLGGLVPLMPYFFIESARQALYWSIGITTIVLLVFGAFKTFFTGAEIGKLALSAFISL